MSPYVSTQTTYELICSVKMSAMKMPCKESCSFLFLILMQVGEIKFFKWVYYSLLPIYYDNEEHTKPYPITDA